MSEVTITLPFADARVVLITLESARREWISDVTKVGGKTTPTPYDDAISAIQSALDGEAQA